MRLSYHSNVASFSAFNSPYSYGLSDMSYYGSFVNAGGCGSMWRPYFASAAWDPYANGTWAWYSGAGYSWVSPYPWAWTPYHSGSWAYCDNVGWGWMPGGGGWYGLNNVAAIPSSIGTTAGGSGVIHAPHVPGHPPLPHAPSMVAVNTKPSRSRRSHRPTSFVFRKDSAGLGVPRGTLGHLGKFSSESISHGTAKTTIYATAPQTGRPNGAMTMSESMATSVHRGSPPPSNSASSSQGSFSSSFHGGASSGGGMGNARSTSGPAPSAPSTGGGVRK